MRWWSEMRERVGALLFRRRADADTAEEMAFHIEMDAQRRVREEGLDAAEARRRAAVAFGGVERHQEQVRDARGFGRLSGLSLDMRLGLRMLAKYPLLTTAGTLTLAVAIALAASAFEFFNLMMSPPLPFDESGRIVAIDNWDYEAASSDPRALHDFARWRAEARTIDDLSAAVRVQVSATSEDGRQQTLSGARMTASSFRALRSAPLLGRTFTSADEAEGAPLTVVLGHAVWQSLYDGDRSVIGRTLRLGGVPATVIGVMPEWFSFPGTQQIWTPLAIDADAWDRREGPALSVFGRLAPGRSLDEAKAEFETIGQRMAAEYPDTHEHLMPRVRTFAQVIGMGPVVQAGNVPLILFLLVVAVNFATLVFARTVTRTGELAVRSALGASRRRLVLQLVAEAFVLTSTAAVLGLFLAWLALTHGMALFWEVQQTSAPAWMNTTVRPMTVAYVASLALLSATIIGGIPALKATSPRLRPQLMQPGSGGAGLRFGRVSTAVIVVQVALCVAFLPFAIQAGAALVPANADTSVDFAAADYLSGRLAVQIDGSMAVTDQRFEGSDVAQNAASFDEAKRRLAALDGVSGAALVTRLPGFNHGVETIVFDNDTTLLHDARAVGVDEDFFELMRARISAGRDFTAADFAGSMQPVVLDAAWAKEYLPGVSPVGLRLRFTERSGEEARRWYEVVGVVEGMDVANGPGESVGIYQPLRPGEHASLQFYLRTTVPPQSLAGEVAEVVSALDSDLTVDGARPLMEHWRPVLQANLFFIGGLTLVALIILLFALIGIYALMSFTVTQRAREIGIRAALGAEPRRIIVSIFSRAMLQIGLGVLIGAALISVQIAQTPAGAGLVAGVATMMLVAGLIGCVVPALRALRIPPTDALRAE